MQQSNEELPSRWFVYASPLLMVAIVLFSMVLFTRAESTSNEVRRIDRVRLQTMRALSALQDAETGQRGYLITGRDEYLDPYVAGKDSVLIRIAELKRYTKGEDVEQQLIEHLVPIVNQRIARLDSAIAARRSGDVAAAIAVVSSGRGKFLMDSARKIFMLIRQKEARMLVQGEDRERKDRNRLQFALILGVIVSAALSFLVSNKLLNDATRHWLLNAEMHARLEMLRGQSARASGETAKRPTPVSNNVIS